MKRLCPATCGCVSATPSVSTTAPAEPTTTPSGSSGCGLDDKAFDCKKKSQMCNVPAYINLMKKLCPETCGCPTSAAPASTTPNAPTTAPAVPTTAPAVPTTTPAVAATTPAASATTPAVAATTPAGSNGCGLDDKAFDCKRKSQMCTVPAYINLMKRLCPETCGCPTTIAPQSTTPNAPATTPALPTTAPAEPTTTPAVPTTTPSGSSGCGLDDKAFDCKRKSQMCTVPAYVNLMKRLCPETCGCPTSNAPQYTTPLGSSGCGLDDKAFDCKRKSQMCTVPRLVAVLRQPPLNLPRLQEVVAVGLMTKRLIVNGNHKCALCLNMWLSFVNRPSIHYALTK
ncbi:unnamed protein product [Bursaphelenchus okinawaensis]|uniref:ShKT domain-containing protein n=1 Tax=Bursaphelenchus okinawaensis TaxID=465554 RepID=A0A811K189_9BILA|nr:unnamed protein product [Bursaphelenchus okinawaensis]CAG9089592.1 unnamed protein product [Bursaphelenchus okinawaensis]